MARSSGKLTLSAVIRLLRNPAYPGAYVYGWWEYVSEGAAEEGSQSQ